MTAKMVESTLDPAVAMLNEVVPAGEPWMGTVRKGEVFRPALEQLGGDPPALLDHGLGGLDKRRAALVQRARPAMPRAARDSRRVGLHQAEALDR